MKTIRHLVIGGGIAGTTAAETIRQHDPDGSIAIVSDEPYRLYSRIMLSKPNFFLGKIPFDQIWLKTESWYGEKNIELILGKKAVGIDAEKRTVALNDGTVLSFEKLLLAPGGTTRMWDLPVPSRGVFYLRTLDDARAITSAVKQTRRAVAVGGGFISFEICDMLRLAGCEVTLVLRESRFWETLLDAESGEIVERALTKGGVKILHSAEVAQVVGKDAVEGVILKDGAHIDCEMVAVGIGLMFQLDWVKNAGMNVNRGIVTNEYMETNVPNAWAAGDAAEFKDVILGEQIQIGNWVSAQMTGQTAALNMTGARKPFKLVSFYTTQGFGITIAFVGDARPIAGRASVSRGSATANSYGRLIMNNGKIIGAALINRTNELSAISKLIEKNVDVTGRERELADPNFDLKTLIA